MSILSSQQRYAVINFLHALISQGNAQVIVPPYAAESGYWFGGGNLVQDENGIIWLCGRYRNYGDSRTGLGAGERGLECAIFRSDDGGKTFEKVQNWAKAELSYENRDVLSIEGTALHQLADGTWELFISSEKALTYPDQVGAYQKSGTGVWTIDRITGSRPDLLSSVSIQPVLENFDYPEYLHIKDPVVYDWRGGETALIFCSHPFSWSSTNSGLAIRGADGKNFSVRKWELVSRGAAWDVAATRITARMPVPRLGLFAGQPPASIYFYDGAESLRAQNENANAMSRPRGYSCEEIGGAFFGWDNDFPTMERLSLLAPLFVSPFGTGASRYVQTLTTEEDVIAIWEQGQPDGSQPLVSHRLSIDEIGQLLR